MPLLFKYNLRFEKTVIIIYHCINRTYHILKGERSDEYAVDLAQPFRLIFKPILGENGDINDLESIDIVRIEEVKDYHGKQKR